jgi:hypothetical protein
MNKPKPMITLDYRNEHIEVKKIENGYIVNYGGKLKESWINKSLYVETLQEVTGLLQEYFILPEDN